MTRFYTVCGSLMLLIFNLKYKKLEMCPYDTDFLSLFHLCHKIFGHTDG